MPKAPQSKLYDTGAMCAWQHIPDGDYQISRKIDREYTCLITVGKIVLE